MSFWSHIEHFLADMVHGNTEAPWPQLAVVTCTARVAIFFLCIFFVGAGALVGRLRAAQQGAAAE